MAAPAVWLPGDQVLPQRLTMSLVGTAAVVVIGLLGRVVAGDRAGLIAAGLAAAYPNLWINDGLVMAESLTALGMALLLTYRRLARFRVPAEVAIVVLAAVAVDAALDRWIRAGPAQDQPALEEQGSEAPVAGKVTPG